MSGAFVQAAVGGISDTVSGIRQHIVTAARVISCSGYVEKAPGKTILSGASEVVASAECVTNCASGSIKAASVKATASGKVVFEGETINIVAASLTTGGGTLSGGAVKVKGANLKGAIERSDNTRLGS